MKSLILMGLIISIGCAPKAPNNIDPAFQALYTQFITQANDAGMNLSVNQNLNIQFTKLEQPDALGEVIGECTEIGYGVGGSIFIDYSYWINADPNTQLLLLYHELGHCVLNEVHTKNSMAIMNAVINQPQQYSATNLSGMIDQLFLDAGDYRLSGCSNGRC